MAATATAAIRTTPAPAARCSSSSRRSSIREARRYLGSDICDPVDAIPAAAAYLKSNGAPIDWQRALYRYNPADWYPPLVLGWAERYGYGARVVWPIEGSRISQRFSPTSFTGEPRLCRGTCYEHFHDGLDLAAPIGTPVQAIASGRVTIAGRMSDGAVVVTSTARASSRGTAISSQDSASGW